MLEWREEYYKVKRDNEHLVELDERLSKQIDELETDLWRLKGLLSKLKEGDFNE